MSVRILVLLTGIFLLVSNAYAEKICPVDGEVYPDSAVFCGKHGKQLKSREKKKPVPQKESPKEVPEARTSFEQTGKIHLSYSNGRIDVFIFNGFNTDCAGYGKNGIQFTENGVTIQIPWRDIKYVLPEFGTVALRNGSIILNPLNEAAACGKGYIEETRKESVLVAGYRKEVSKKVRIGINEMDVIAFGSSALEDGIKKRDEKRKIKAAAEEEKRLAGEFVFVRGGCFQMGDTFMDGDEDEKPVHEVCVDNFYIGRYEVTQEKWRLLMGSNPSYFKECGDNCPVEQVSWNDIQEFIRKLNEKTTPLVPLNKGGKRGLYRLPTEAEWEYAARSSGKTEKYSGGNNPNVVAWHLENSWNKTRTAGRKRQNGLGIFDMSGNVAEWVNDWYDSSYYGKSPTSDPAGPSSGSLRVLRGGSWHHSAKQIRTSYRMRNNPNAKSYNFGFRLARNP